MTDGKWIVLRTRGGFEMKAQVDVHRREFVTFLPKVLEERVVRRRPLRLASVQMPLFPGYLFVLVAPGQSWGDIVGCCRGVLGVVRGPEHNGDVAAEMSPRVIESIRRRLAHDGGAVKPSNPWDEMSYGEPVALRGRVLRGPFSDQESIFQRSAIGRVRGMLGLLRVELSEGDVAILEPKPKSIP